MPFYGSAYMSIFGSKIALPTERAVSRLSIIDDAEKEKKR
jgi:hypothetical protein